MAAFAGASDGQHGILRSIMSMSECEGGGPLAQSAAAHRIVSPATSMGCMMRSLPDVERRRTGMASRFG